jgi:glycerophosphoryl diester phosphodiesterase
LNSLSIFNVYNYVERRMPIQCFAHRGYSGLYPENTMLSLQKAVDVRVDIIEFDVRMSRDGVLIVIHDATVDRTTNGSGLVSDMTIKKIQSLDAGSGERIPTFMEVIGEMAGKIGMNINMKTPGKAIEYCKEAKILDEVFFSFSYIDEIRRIKKKYPDVSLCSLYRDGNYSENSLKMGVKILQPLLNSELDKKRELKKHIMLTASVMYFTRILLVIFCIVKE